MGSFSNGTTLGALRVLNEQADEAFTKLRNLDNLIEDVTSGGSASSASVSGGSGAGGAGGGGNGSGGSFGAPTYSARDRFLIDRFLQTVQQGNTASLQGGFVNPNVTAGTATSIRAGSS